MTKTVDELIADSGKETFLEESDWLQDIDAAQTDTLHAKFSASFDRWLASFIEKLGEPTFTSESDSERADDVYPEAMRLACWSRPDGLLFLAYGQHDRETPIFVSAGLRQS